jgi:hypothetical protein
VVPLDRNRLIRVHPARSRERGSATRRHRGETILCVKLRSFAMQHSAFMEVQVVSRACLPCHDLWVIVARSDSDFCECNQATLAVQLRRDETTNSFARL